MKSNIALSYIAMLSVVGFFLWVIRNFVRGLRNKDQSDAAMAPAIEPEDSKQQVNWPVHIFLDKSDDIPIPGQIVSVNTAVAYMESSACLQTGQDITLYVDIPNKDQVRLTALVTWARESRLGKNAAQLSFPSLSEERRKELLVNV